MEVYVYVPIIVVLIILKICFWVWRCNRWNRIAAQRRVVVVRDGSARHPRLTMGNNNPYNRMEEGPVHPADNRPNASAPPSATGATDGKPPPYSKTGDVPPIV